jgi:hypothetical protein
MSSCIPPSRQDSFSKKENQISSSGDSIFKHIPFYKTPECLGNLLRKIGDANQRHFDEVTDFYSLSFQVQSDKQFIVIHRGKDNLSKEVDYVGALKFGKNVFLCRGDIESSSLFTKTSNDFLNIYLILDTKRQMFSRTQEPTLRGLFTECEGSKLVFEVYTIEGVPEYIMQNQ